MAKKQPTAEIKRHWGRLSELGCIITGSPHPTIHHCHGASMKNIGVHRGKGQKPNDWLTIGLRFDYHVGDVGIDSGFGVFTWEKMFGKQVYLLDKTCILLGYNVWKKADIDRSIEGLD